MRTTSFFAGVSVLVLVPLALAASAWGAKPSVLTWKTAGGEAVVVGDELRTGLSAGTQLSLNTTEEGAVGVQCTTSTLAGDTSINPETGAVPKAADVELKTWSIGACVSNIVGTTGVQGVTVNLLPYTLSFSDAAGLPVAIQNPKGEVKLTVVLKTLLGNINCTYEAPFLKGAFGNAKNTITFSPQLLVNTAGPATCPVELWLKATYGPLEDMNAMRRGVVFVN